MATTWISDEMRAAVGGELRTAESFPISVSDIRRWAQAVYYPDPPPARYWDEDHESTRRLGGIVAPEEFNPFAWMTASGPREASVAQGAFGPEVALGLAPPATRFVLNGGLSASYTAVGMRPGDVVRSATSLNSYEERSGRLGLMLFTVTEDRWTNQRGELVKTVQATLIRY